MNILLSHPAGVGNGHPLVSILNNDIVVSVVDESDHHDKKHRNDLAAAVGPRAIVLQTVLGLSGKLAKQALFHQCQLDLSVGRVPEHLEVLCR